MSSRLSKSSKPQPAAWLLLVFTLPTAKASARVGVWRKLQRMGAVRLRGASWMLPETPETTELFQWLVQEIQSVRGEATLLRVDRVIEILGKDTDLTNERRRARETRIGARGRQTAASRSHANTFGGKLLQEGVDFLKGLPRAIRARAG